MSPPGATVRFPDRRSATVGRNQELTRPMTRLLSVVAGACLTIALPIALPTGRPVATATQKPAATAAGPGWTNLFDGKTLTGWRGYKKTDAADSRWAVQDGLLTLSAGDAKDTRGSRDIITTETFDLFELSWEWKVSPGGNSGLKYYVLEDQNSAIGH